MPPFFFAVMDARAGRPAKLGAASQINRLTPYGVPDQYAAVKQLFLILSLISACGAVYAGESYSGKDKEIMQTAPPPCDWYRAHEWDFDLWGPYAFPGNTGRHTEFDRLTTFNNLPAHEKLTASNDRFIDRDNAWGGGVDVKYFFSKYWGLGVEGTVIDCNINEGGAGFGTFTFRYPIGCSRFAPYGWVGGGVTAGGGHHEQFSATVLRLGSIVDTNDIQNKHAEPTAQFGTGIECRITRHVGLMTDFAWNLVSGPDNNFGMWRFGATLSY